MTPRESGFLSKLLASFFRGLAFVAPIAITVYVCVAIFTTIDGWLGLRIPGAGFVITIVLITAVGFLASNLLTRGLLSLVERTLDRLPFVRLLYGATRDLLNAFVGEKRKFDKPVLVTLFTGGSVRVFGFLTQESLAQLDLVEHVAVYIPQSYGFAGNLIVVPAANVEAVSADSPEVMAFIISGGVTRWGDAPAAVAPTATPPA